MNATVDIGLGGLLAVYLLLFIPLWFNWRLKLGLNKELLWTVLRMSVQLLLVGYYLEYLFRWNRPGLNLLWLLVMLLVANVTTLKRSKLPATAAGRNGRLPRRVRCHPALFHADDPAGKALV